MPHLSPMKWTLMSLFFLLSLMTFISTMWWKQLPFFSHSTKEKKKLKKNWLWYY